MTISILGIGWLTKDGYGCVRCGRQQEFAHGEDQDALAKKEIFSRPFKNFGRLDQVSRNTAYGVALALQDAGIGYNPGRKRNIGIIGTNRDGSLGTDGEYFRDYLRSGRTLSRGNLFIYTLPSSPLGEAAIHFGFLGPLLYCGVRDASLPPLLDMAAAMLASGEAEMMVAGRADEKESVFFVLARPAAGDTAVCALAEARPLLESTPDLAGIVKQFSFLEARKA